MCFDDLFSLWRKEFLDIRKKVLFNFNNRTASTIRQRYVLKFVCNVPLFFIFQHIIYKSLLLLTCFDIYFNFKLNVISAIIVTVPNLIMTLVVGSGGHQWNFCMKTARPGAPSPTCHRCDRPTLRLGWRRVEATGHSPPVWGSVEAAGHSLTTSSGGGNLTQAGSLQEGLYFLGEHSTARIQLSFWRTTPLTLPTTLH